MPDTSGTLTSHLAAGQPAFTTATRVGGYQVERPFFPEDPAALLISAPYEIELTSYAPAAENSANADFAGSYFTGDGPLEDIGMGMCRFIRSWATVPATRTLPGSIGFTYPGFLDLRPPFSQSVPTQIEEEFFLVGAGTAYATPLDIPFVQETQVLFSAGVRYGMGAGSFFLNNGGAGTDPSSPTLAAYLALVDDDDADPASFSIIAQAGTLQRHAGNIWGRRVVSVKAL